MGFSLVFDVIANGVGDFSDTQAFLHNPAISVCCVVPQVQPTHNI